MASQRPSKANIAFDRVLCGYSLPIMVFNTPYPACQSWVIGRGSVYLPSGDKLLITYQEQLACPENTSVKWDSALSWLSPCQPQVCLCQDALKPEMEVKKLFSVGTSCWLVCLVYSYYNIGEYWLASFSLL